MFEQDIDTKGNDASPKTIAELLYRLPTQTLRDELEEYRMSWEQAHGRRVDLTRRYTSTWPREQQNFLFHTDPKRYYDGLPPFVQDYIKGKMMLYARDGALDDAPEEYMQMFVRGLMNGRGDSRSR